MTVAKALSQVDYLIHEVDPAPIEVMFAAMHGIMLLLFFLFASDIVPLGQYDIWLRHVSYPYWSALLVIMSVSHMAGVLLKETAVRIMATCMSTTFFPAMAVMYWSCGRTWGLCVYIIFTLFGIWAITLLLQKRS